MHFDCAGSHEVWVAALAYGILLVNSPVKCFLCNVQVHFDFPGWHKVWPAVLACIILLVNSRT